MKNGVDMEMLKEEHNFGDNKLLPVGDAIGDTLAMG